MWKCAFATVYPNLHKAGEFHSIDTVQLLLPQCLHKKQANHSCIYLVSNHDCILSSLGLRVRHCTMEMVAQLEGLKDPLNLWCLDPTHAPCPDSSLNTPTDRELTTCAAHPFSLWTAMTIWKFELTRKDVPEKSAWGLFLLFSSPALFT